MQANFGKDYDIFKRATYTVVGSSLDISGAFLDDKRSKFNTKKNERVKNAQNAAK